MNATGGRGHPSFDNIHTQQQRCSTSLGLIMVQSQQPGAWYRPIELASPWDSTSAARLLPPRLALMPHHPGAGGAVSLLQPLTFCPPLHKLQKRSQMRAKAAPSHQDGVVWGESPQLSERSVYNNRKDKIFPGMAAKPIQLYLCRF